MISKLLTTILMSASVITTPTIKNTYKAANEIETEEREDTSQITTSNFEQLRSFDVVETTSYYREYTREYFYKHVNNSVIDAEILYYSQTINGLTKSTDKWQINNSSYFIVRCQNVTDIALNTNIFRSYITKSLNITAVGTGTSNNITFKQEDASNYTLKYYNAKTNQNELQELYTTQNYSYIQSLSITGNDYQVEETTNQYYTNLNPITNLGQESNFTNSNKNTIVIRSTTNAIPKYINNEYVNTESQQGLAVKTNIISANIQSEFTWLIQINGGNINYEVIDLPTLMLTILSLPFNFLTTAFNVTLFPGTPYAINFANLFKGLIAILALLFIVKLFTRGLDAIGSAKDKSNNKPSQDDKPKKQDKGE